MGVLVVGHWNTLSLTYLQVTKKLLTFNIYRRYTKRSCRCGDHNAHLSRLGVPNDGGIQPHYHRRIDGFQLPVSFLARPPYRSNRRWKYHTDAYIATAVKVTTMKDQSVVVLLRLVQYLGASVGPGDGDMDGCTTFSHQTHLGFGWCFGLADLSFLHLHISLFYFRLLHWKNCI